MKEKTNNLDIFGYNKTKVH